MALTVEDGSVVAGANSFVSVADFTAFATSRGETTIAGLTDDEKEQLILKAMDWFEAQEPKFQGYRVSSDQELTFPRYEVVLHNFVIAGNVVPPLVVKIINKAAIIANTNDLQPTLEGAGVIAEKVGPLETRWSDKGGDKNRSHFTELSRLMAQIKGNVGGQLNVSRAY